MLCYGAHDVRNDNCCCCCCCCYLVPVPDFVVGGRQNGRRERSKGVFERTTRLLVNRRRLTQAALPTLLGTWYLVLVLVQLQGEIDAF